MEEKLRKELVSSLYDLSAVVLVQGLQIAQLQSMLISKEVLNQEEVDFKMKGMKVLHDEKELLALIEKIPPIKRIFERFKDN